MLAPRVKTAAMLASNDVVERLLKVVLEEGLETAEHEVASRVSKDNKAEVYRNQVLAEGVALQARERRDFPDHAMSHRVDETEKIGTRGGKRRILAGARDSTGLEHREAGCNWIDECPREVPSRC